MATETRQIAIRICKKSKILLDRLCRKTGKSQRKIIETAIIECGPAIEAKYATSIKLRKD